MFRIIAVLLFIPFAGCNNGRKKDEKEQVVGNIPAGDSLINKKKWSYADYERAIALFKTLKDGNPDAFIKYIHTDGATLFEKFTDHTQYDSLYVGKDLEKRLYINMGLGDNLRTLNKLCTILRREKGKLILGHEFIRVSIAQLVSFRTSISLINERFPDKENLDDVRKGGLKKMKAGLLGMIRGSLITIYHDHELYLRDDILVFSRFMASYIKTVRSFLDEDQQKEVGEEIKRVISSDTYEDAKNFFSE